MSWHEDCDSFDSRIEASAKDANFNDTEFLLIQADAEDPAGDKVSANKAILALISPVFYAQFYGPLSTNQPPPIQDGTARGFKQLIKFICNPISFDLPDDNVVEVLEISYFAHKYQIGSLVSLCLQRLGTIDEKELDILNWALSPGRGLAWKETLTKEHRLLVHRCWTQVQLKFRLIFPNGEVNDDITLLDEGLMLDILGSKYLYGEEHLILRVALGYYSKIFEKGQKHLDDSKKFKMDIESKWNEKLAKLKLVIPFDKISPKMFSELFEKIVDKVPSSVIGNILKSICPSWKDEDSFCRYEGKRHIRNGEDKDRKDSMFTLDCNKTDWIHDDQLSNGGQVSLTFKTNQDAILNFYSANMHNCYERICGTKEVNCCAQDIIKLQNEGHYKDELPVLRIKYYDMDHHFYVEGNKKVRVWFEESCKESSCPVHLERLQKFHYSEDNFSMEILEVNGQPVTSPCYTFFHSIDLTPL